jgi:metallo-beta-lactamase family protein
MKLIFCGAAGEVTGSSFLLETGSARILIDCGLFQGTRFAEKKNYSPFPFDPSTVDAMVLTHAHLDHCGRIPKLWERWLSGENLWYAGNSRPS